MKVSTEDWQQKHRKDRRLSSKIFNCQDGSKCHFCLESVSVGRLPNYLVFQNSNVFTLGKGLLWQTFIIPTHFGLSFLLKMKRMKQLTK